MVSKASEDLPLPDRPVITTRWSRGMSTSTPFRLCSRAPRTEMCFCMPAVPSCDGRRRRPPCQKIEIGRAACRPTSTCPRNHSIAAIAGWREGQGRAYYGHERIGRTARDRKTDRATDRTTLGESMAGSVNKVILVGNLGRDPEVRNTQNGDPIVHLNMATSENWKDRQSGERRERTEWHRRGDFQRESRPHRPAIPAQGLQDLYRGPITDPQMDRPIRPGALYDRDRAPALPGRDDHAGYARRRRGRLRRRRPRQFRWWAVARAVARTTTAVVVVVGGQGGGGQQGGGGGQGGGQGGGGDLDDEIPF